MKLNFFNSINFQKTLVANCYSEINGEKIGSFSKLDKNEDKDYFKKLNSDLYWKKGYFLTALNRNINKKTSKNSFYVFEDNNGECIGYCQTTDNKKNQSMNVDYFATQPKNLKISEVSKIKNKGSIFMSFLLDIAKRKNYSVDIDYATPFACGFYDKYGFRKIEPCVYTISNEDVNKLSALNQKFADVTISFIS